MPQLRAISPYQVHLVSLGENDAKAQEIYQSLVDSGIEVLWDDRKVSAGEKLNDADLLGIPVRLLVSDKTGDKIEFKRRAEEQVKLLELPEVISMFRE